MILSDFECPSGHIHEELVHWKQKKHKCRTCGKTSKKIISKGHLQSDENAPWLKSVLDVVDKDNKSAHVQNFVKNPTRQNYKAWMKGEGIRPMDYTERGGPPVYRKPEGMSTEQKARELYKRHLERKSLNINS